jgi:hypothetical protein
MVEQKTRTQRKKLFAGPGAGLALVREYVVMMEHSKILNLKHQITNKSQITIFNEQNKRPVWNLGFRSL